MILNGDTIKQHLKKQTLITNGNPDNVHSSSYDITAENYILKFKIYKEPIAFTDIESIDNMYEKIDIKDFYELKPHETILIPIKEEFNIPNGICGHLRGRTSFNRLGLLISNQHLNPGYKGHLNITISNQSPNTYKLLPNMHICQIVFEELNNNVSESLMYYNEKTPFYYNENNTTGSKIYGDFIGKVVRHFKGNYYYIENICMDSETKEYMIIYRNLYNRDDSNIWTRPAKMFFETIDENRPDNITKQKHRFEIDNSLTIDYTKKDSNNENKN